MVNIMDGGVRCMVMRGGSSKGAYFLAQDLPKDEVQRDSLLLRIMGTPDPRQIDGIGGAHPLTSKVAIVAPSTDPDVDVEYLFLQLGVDRPIITDRQTCGNLLAGIGPFAVERGLVEATGSYMSVRIKMLNVNSSATASFPVREGLPVYVGDTAISGVPGTAAPIQLDFADTAGGTTGALLPSGSVVDVIEGIPCTLIDNGMPVVVMKASDMGVTGNETCAELDADEALRSKLERVRHRAAELMGLGDVSKSTIPKLTLVSEPRHGGTVSTRTFIPHRCHDAIGVLGAVTVATAVVLDGSPASEVAVAPAGDSVVLEHPTGSFEALIGIEQTSTGDVSVDRAGIVRTARKLMDGYVFPRTY